MKVWRLETKLQELKSLLRETGSSWELHIFAKSRLKARDKPGPPKKQCGLALCSEFCLQRSAPFSAVQCLAVQCTEWNVVHWVQRTQLSSCKNDSQGYRQDWNGNQTTMQSHQHDHPYQICHHHCSIPLLIIFVITSLQSLINRKFVESKQNTNQGLPDIVLICSYTQTTIRSLLQFFWICLLQICLIEQKIICPW